MYKFKTLAAAAAISLATTATYADGHAKGWTLDAEASQVAFASIKENFIGESHSFGNISGSVSADGAVSIELGLLSVETLIDIRNERMIEHVFKKEPTATISAQLDMAKLLELPVGGSMDLETSGTLSLLDTDTALDAKFFVMRVSDDKVLVTTDGMLMLDTDEAGIDAGIDVLKELAGLDSIARVSPVTMRLFFDAGA